MTPIFTKVEPLGAFERRKIMLKDPESSQNSSMKYPKPKPSWGDLWISLHKITWSEVPSQKNVVSLAEQLLLGSIFC